MGGKAAPFYLRLPLRTAAAFVTALAAGCSSDDQPPSRLMDGSRARPLRVTLDGVTRPPVLTATRVVHVGDVARGATSASCLRRRWGGPEPGEWFVERTGVVTETVTFRDRSGRGLYGCDNSEGPREAGRRWCGAAFGRLYSGHLADPRLDAGGCATRDERPVGFVWVEPHEDARYVVVEEPRYAEVYRVAGELAVRVATTSGVEIDESRATFQLSEHDREGRRLRRYRVEAAVAG